MNAGRPGTMALEESGLVARARPGALAGQGEVREPRYRVQHATNWMVCHCRFTVYNEHIPCRVTLALAFPCGAGADNGGADNRQSWGNESEPEAGWQLGSARASYRRKCGR